MTAQKGKDLLVKIDDGSGFVTVAGLRTRRLAFNAETVDITHAESAGRWRELLEGAGVKRASVSGRGLFKDAATDALMRQTFFDGAVKSYQIVIPDFGTVEGPFQITSLEFAGEHNGEVTYELSLESAGALTFAAMLSALRTFHIGGLPAPSPRERSERWGGLGWGVLRHMQNAPPPPTPPHHAPRGGRGAHRLRGAHYPVHHQFIERPTCPICTAARLRPRSAAGSAAWC